MSRTRRFGGHEAVFCISKICGSISTSRWGFLFGSCCSWILHATGFCLYVVAWHGGTKRRLFAFVRRGFVRTITT